MKYLYISLCLIFSFYFSFSCQIAQAREGVIVIKVTDNNGKIDILSDPLWWDYSQAHRDSIYEHLQVNSLDKGNKIYWVHFSQIKTANFEKRKNKININILLDNNESLKGYFHDDHLVIRGIGKKGKVKYKIGSIKKLEFVKFMYWDGHMDKCLDREEYAVLWRNSNNPGAKWIIKDKNITYSVGCPIAILDNYKTNLDFGVLYNDNRIKFSKIIELNKMEDNNKEIPWGAIDEITLTSEKDKHNAVELIMQLSSGETKSVPLELKSFEIFYPPKDKVMFKLEETKEKIKYGIDRDDRIINKTDFGWESCGTLLPIRKIIFKRINK